MQTALSPELLAAFEAEAREHLERVRAILAAAENEGNLTSSQIEDVYRRVHTLKGASRSVNLVPAQGLAHRLESILSRVRNRALTPGGALVRLLHQAIDAIEDQVTGLLNNRAASEPAGILQLLDQALNNGPGEAPEHPDSGGGQIPSSEFTLEAELAAAFQQEAQQHFDRLGVLLQAWEDSGVIQNGPEIEEAKRLAHTLKGAARAVNFPAVQTLARGMEQIFSKCRGGQLAGDLSVLKTLRSTLDCIGASVQARNNRQPEPDTTAVLEWISKFTGTPAKPEVPVESPAAPAPAPALAPESTPEPKPAPAPAQPPVEILRISAKGLDQMLRTTGELLTEAFRQRRATERLAEYEGQFAALETRFQRLRRALSSTSAKRDGISQAQLVSDLDVLESEVRSLAREARATRQHQERSSWSLSTLAERLQDDVRRARMVPAENLLQGFRTMVREIAAEHGKEVEFQIRGLEVEADRAVFQALKDPIMHMLRNAVGHGIEVPERRRQLNKPSAGQVQLQIEARGNRLLVTVSDDGRGIDLSSVARTAVQNGLMSEAEAASASRDELHKLLFHPGFSTAGAVTNLSGRGIGLTVVQESVSRLQGDIQIIPRPGGGASFQVSVPLSISTHRLLFVRAGGQLFGLPLHGIERLIRLRANKLEFLEGKPVVRYENQPLALQTLDHVLHGREGAIQSDGEAMPVVILKSGAKLAALVVDGIVGDREGLLMDLGRAVRPDRKIAGGVLLEDGEVVLVLNPVELVSAAERTDHTPTFTSAEAERSTAHAPAILIVDDSFTTRTLEKGILETHGYRVHLAVNGQEGLNKLRSEKIDLMVVDVQMPVMDGFAMLEEVKRSERLASIPVIMVTSMDTQEYRERGLSLGASAYLSKQTFEQQELLDTIRQLIG